MTIFQTQDCCRCCSRWAVKCLVPSRVPCRLVCWLVGIPSDDASLPPSRKTRCTANWKVLCTLSSLQHHSDLALTNKHYVSIRVSHWLYPILVYVSHIKVHHYDGTRLLFQGCHLGNQYIDNARIGQGRSVAELVRFVADNLAQNAAHNLARSRHG
jgi:hypothetical protein